MCHTDGPNVSCEPHMCPFPPVQQAAPAHVRVGVGTARAIAPRAHQLPARASTTTQSLYINAGRLWERLCVSEEVWVCCYRGKFHGLWHNPTAAQTHCWKRSFLTSNSSQQCIWESYHYIAPDWQLTWRDLLTGHFRIYRFCPHYNICYQKGISDISSKKPSWWTESGWLFRFYGFFWGGGGRGVRTRWEKRSQMLFS